MENNSKFKIKHSKLLDMCKDSWRWQSNNPDGYQDE
jgi:hypothetical protein